jgi:hypothetical protein
MRLRFLQSEAQSLEGPFETTYCGDEDFRRMLGAPAEI